MQYKTIIMELLEQRPQIHEELRRSRELLPTIELYARELKENHQAWKERLRQTKPGSDPSQITGEAMELATKDMEGRFPSEFSRNEIDAFPRDRAMANTSRHTPRG
jgi:hypothetical protein